MVLLRICSAFGFSFRMTEASLSNFGNIELRELLVTANIVPLISWRSRGSVTQKYFRFPSTTENEAILTGISAIKNEVLFAVCTCPVLHFCALVDSNDGAEVPTATPMVFNFASLQFLSFEKKKVKNSRLESMKIWWLFGKFQKWWRRVSCMQ